MSNFIKEWTQREIDGLTKTFRRHTFLIFTLKFVLPITALAMVAALFIYPAVSGKAKKIVLVAQQNKVDTQNPVMVNPRYQGLDSNNQQYQVTAKRAVQLPQINLVNLEEVKADITLNDGKWVSIIANKGLYDRDNHTMQLDGDVNAFMTDATGSATQVTTQSAFVDIANGIVKGSVPMQSHSDMGTLTAEHGFLAKKADHTINFYGPVKVVILQNKSNTAAKPAAKK